jgi:hypothetical protein
MQRLLTVLVLAAIAAVLFRPALAGNQEVADEIAKTLKSSGKLSNYKVEVQYRQGTARLKGHVQSRTQVNTALKLAFQTAGVKRVVNELAVSSPASPQAASPKLAGQSPTNPKPPAGARPAAAPEVPSQATSAVDWLKKVVASEQQQEPRGSAQPETGRRAGRAQRVPSSFSPAPAKQVAVTGAVEARTMPRRMIPRSAGRPIPIAYTQAAGRAPGAQMPASPIPGGPLPAYVAGAAGGVAPARYDQPRLPNYSWPSYAAYPNYAGLTYPRQYSPTAWPYIGPFYPYPQVPLGWRKVTLEWDDGWWMLDFRDSPSCCPW